MVVVEDDLFTTPRPRRKYSRPRPTEPAPKTQRIKCAYCNMLDLQLDRIALCDLCRDQANERVADCERQMDRLFREMDALWVERDTLIDLLSPRDKGRWDALCATRAKYIDSGLPDNIMARIESILRDPSDPLWRVLHQEERGTVLFTAHTSQLNRTANAIKVLTEYLSSQTKEVSHV